MGIRSKGIISIFTVLAISFPVLTLFQNCSGQISAVMVEDELAGKLGVNENGIGSDSLPLGQSVPFEQPGAPVPPPISVIEPPSVMPEPQPMPAPEPQPMPQPIVSLPEPQPAPAPAPSPGKSEDRGPASSEPPVVMLPPEPQTMPAPQPEPQPMPAPAPQPMPVSDDDDDPVPNVQPSPVPSGPVISEEEEREIAAECSRAANSAESNNKNKKQVVSSNSLSGSNGKKIISRSNFGGNSSIDFIEDIHGHHVICDLNVRVLRNSSGKIILFKTNVQQIEGVGGNIIRLGD